MSEPMANAAGSLPLTASRPPLSDTNARHAAARPATVKVRVESVDLLRGLIMVIMMLDHTRDYVHRDALAFDAANVARTFPALFFTRWITHFCAPLFVFLAGTSVSFQEMRGKSKAQLSRFLLTRGLWLVAIEIVVLRPLLFFNFNYGEMLAFLQVIWIIGWSMVVLAASIHIPRRWLVVISLAVIALHNTLDGVRVTTFNGPGTPLPGFGASLWIVLHQQGLIFPFGFPVFVVYPFVPWMAVMSVGYAFGWWYRKAEPDRRRLFVRLGVAIVLGFIMIRAINIYGDPSRWTQFGGVKTFLSFLATTKYPPSLLYLMMTLGPGILFLGWAERHTRSPYANVFITFGRVPFFFYLLQWIVAHLLAVGLSWMTGRPVAYLFTNFILAPALPAGAGFSLGVVYLLWILGAILTYPLCVWFAGVKARRRDWWLSYL
jgi:uncharacterized membrane protein